MTAGIGVELRRSERVVCHGQVRLSDGDRGRETIGEMVDVSAGGFRVCHDDPDLRPGTEIRFEHLFFVGRAKVVWTDRLAGRLHSGLQVLLA